MLSCKGRVSAAYHNQGLAAAAAVARQVPGHVRLADSWITRLLSMQARLVMATGMTMD
jgi:hypothetical protein